MVASTKTKLFSSAMTGAPVLSGTAGALIAVLDAVLVNGFGITAVTSVVVAANIATANYGAGHPFSEGSVVLISGATPAGLNGEARVLSSTANTITWGTTGISDQTATGTISSKVAPVGWVKTFSGTNKASYKSVDVEGTGFTLRVNDTTTTSALVRGFETMSDVDTGTGGFPPVSKWANGLFWSKSSAADASARVWRIIADSRGFHIYARTVTSAEFQGNYFGDLVPVKSGDAFACVLRANVTDKANAQGGYVDDLVYSEPVPVTDGLYVARAPNSLGGGVQMGNCAVFTLGNTGNYTAGSAGLTYPSMVTNGLTLSKVAVFNSQGLRGYYPGVLVSNQICNAAFQSDDLIDGTGDFVGEKLRVLKTGPAAANTSQGVLFFKYNANWR